MGIRRIGIFAAAISLLAFVVWGIGVAAAYADVGVTANPDTVETHKNTPVDFDPTANDTVEPGSVVTAVEIESDPSHGTATVNPDGITIHYEPDTDYVGTDAMEYNIHVCAELSELGANGTNQINPEACTEDTGAIDITVTDVVATTTTTTTTTVAEQAGPPTTTTTVAATPTTVAAAALPTTVAAAPAGRLPETGGGSSLLGPGSLLVALGAALLLLTRGHGVRTRQRQRRRTGA